jgi:hypothetical protein
MWQETITSTYLIVDYEVQLSSGPPQQGIPTNVSLINKK